MNLPNKLLSQRMIRLAFIGLRKHVSALFKGDMSPLNKAATCRSTPRLSNNTTTSAKLPSASLWFGTFLTLLALGLSACSQNSQPNSSTEKTKTQSASTQPATDFQAKQKPLPKVELITLKPQTLSVRAATTATVEPVRVAILSSAAEGPVMRLHTQEGKMVEANTRLLEIGRNTAQHQAVRAAEQTLERYQHELQRARSLIEKGAISQELLDTAESAFKQAQSALAHARQQAQDFLIYAPWTGAVTHIHVREGTVIAPRQPLIELYDPTSLVLRFELSESHAMQLREGDTITARLSAYPNQEYPLTVTCAYAELDRNTRKRRFEAALASVQEPLIPGLFGEVIWDTAVHENVFVLPAAAILRNPSGDYFIYRVNAANTAEAISIQILDTQDEAVAIAPNSTLKTGDRVVIHGQKSIQPGQRVQPISRASSPKTGLNPSDN